MRHGMAAALALALVGLGAPPSVAQLRGHGGPVRALAVSADGTVALTGSFDQTAIRWSLPRNAAEQVLRFHDGAVNAVALLADGRQVTAGADGRIALWRPPSSQPERVFDGHQGPVVGLAVSPDGRMLASASWDHTARLWPLAGGEGRTFGGHQGNVNGVAFSPDGRALVTASYDGRLRIWPREGEAPPAVVTLPAPLNAVAVAPDGDIVVGAADGRVRFLSAGGEVRGEVEAGPAPVTAVALSRDDGALVAAAGSRGSIAIIDGAERRLVRTLVGAGLPVWALAFTPDGALLAAGGDRIVHRWNAATGESADTLALTPARDPLAAYAGDRGAEVFRACVACHSLSPEEGPRAGPSLHHIFGRRIATLPGYDFSAALRAMDIVWTPDTVARLFEVGPATYTPGTKMPEQRITSAEDRAALVAFLARATQGK